MLLAGPIAQGEADDMDVAASLWGGTYDEPRAKAIRLEASGGDEDAANAHLEALRSRSAMLVHENWDAIVGLADLLIEHETLTRPQIRGALTTR